MKSDVETLTPTRVRLTVEVPFEELKPSLDEAYRTIGSQVTIPGFRKGKVPTSLIDQRFGRGVVLDEAVNAYLPDAYGAAVREHEVRVLGQPDIDVTEFADGADLKFTAEVDCRPEITLPDYDGLEVEVAEVVPSRGRRRRAGRSAARPFRHPDAGRARGRDGRLPHPRPQREPRRRGHRGRDGGGPVVRGRHRRPARRARRGRRRPQRRRGRHVRDRAQRRRGGPAEIVVSP